MQKTILMDSKTLLRKVTQKKIDIFSDTDAVMFLCPLKSHNAFVFYPGNPIMPLIIQ